MENNLISTIWNAGIVGEGGAGFPTHIKVNAEVDTVIANGCECEPLIHTDQYIMEKNAQDIVAAMEMVRNHTKAERAIIGLKKKYTKIVEIFEEIITDYPHIALCLLDNTYPAGDEQILVFEATGRSIPPTGIPLHVGCLVLNVGTLASIYKAHIEGKSVTEKVVTITGAVKNPALLTVPIGTSVEELIQYCGGSLTEDNVYILGGPMMGKFIETEEEKKAAVVTKTLGAVIIIKKDSFLHEYASLTPEEVSRNAKLCIQCRLCTELCPRYLIGHPLYPHKIMQAIAHNNEDPEVLKSAILCCGCGICELYACPMYLSPRAVNFVAKDKLRAQGYQYKAEDKKIYNEHIEQRENRLLPTNRLSLRIDVEKYMQQETPDKGFYTPQYVNIPLSQHIGMAAEAVVKVGDKVQKNECIGKTALDKVGAQIHASIDGEVVSVGSSIKIKGK